MNRPDFCKTLNCSDDTHKRFSQIKAKLTLKKGVTQNNNDVLKELIDSFERNEKNEG